MLYKTIEHAFSGEYKDKGSKFIAYAYPFQHADELKNRLETLRAEHLKACHFCYAYRLGTDKLQYRANDDGEPSGSAGRPILGQIDSLELTDVLVVVVRYYGGTNLGVSGLIKAYKTSTVDALRQAEIITKETMVQRTVNCTYPDLTRTMQQLRRLQATVIAQHFEGNDVTLTVEMPETLALNI